MMTFQRFLALRYLFARKGDGFLSVIAGFSLVGIILGVATLIIVMSVFNGFRDDLLQRVLGFGSHATVVSLSGPLVDYDPLVQNLSTHPEVTQVMPIIDGQVLTTFDGISSGAYVRGIHPADFEADPMLRRSLIAGDVRDFNEGRGIIVGRGVADQYGLMPGSKLVLLSPRGTATAFGTVPRMQAFPVVGVFEVGMYQYDASLIFMPFEMAQAFFKVGEAGQNAASALYLKVDNPLEVKRITDELLPLADRGIQIYDWQDQQATFFDALVIQQIFMFIVVTLIILVAAFNIISMLIIMVKDKRSSIGIMRAMGATRGQITGIFMLTGSSLAIFGIMVGVAAGLVLAVNVDEIRLWLESMTGQELFSPKVYGLTQLPSKIIWSQVIGVSLMALVLALLASFYPAWRAARQDPVEALKNE